jgi:predicted O-methyltransferase YrrM
MLALLEEVLRTQTVRSVDGTLALPLKDAIDAETGALLQSLIQERRPRVGLEIGLAYGVSALFICEALTRVGATRHIVLDCGQSTTWHGIGLKHLREAGFGPLVEFRENPSQDALPQLVTEGVQVDFVFIDGAHSFDQKLVDFFYVDRLLRIGGVVAFDDCNWPSIHQVCRFIATNRPYRVCGATSGSPPRLRGRTIQWFARHSSSVRQILQPKFVQPDADLGFRWNSRCVAFEKLAEFIIRPDYVFREF